ncbi:MAG: hypothetical protein OEW68_11235 [Gammaproteobacteria bacterium]|nr:hypothetical protein [Gammaproteobacteria bacterium]MDH4315405.1 hypothetical protein [Gammaproteobacteria bacterium]MDH5212651.1 hypothetical protein [Gammaproteobacteria bacterium]MDH5500278.1 hypothetical protein [Gammaproteobacteria bacterium]
MRGGSQQFVSGVSTVAKGFRRELAISKDTSFSECVILDRDAFDPDAVFLDDIVDDDVLPRLSLAVDGLTSSGEKRHGRMELRPEDVANEVIPESTRMPVSDFDPDQLEVYGWESSWWKKLIGYIGF